MEVVNTLATARMSVDNDTEAVTGNTFLLRSLSREIQHFPQKLGRCLE